MLTSAIDALTQGAAHAGADVNFRVVAYSRLLAMRLPVDPFRTSATRGNPNKTATRNDCSGLPQVL
jgi:hypothetical protein